MHTVSQAQQQVRLIVLLGVLVAFGPLSIDMYLPALPAIAADLGALVARIQPDHRRFLAGFAAACCCTARCPTAMAAAGYC
jgi:DHA1 family bicyclomycin/chloramphenicol resistance-like MFS transporter